MKLSTIQEAFDNADQDTLKLFFVFHEDSRYKTYTPNLANKDTQSKLLSLYEKVFNNFFDKKKRFLKKKNSENKIDYCDFKPTVHRFKSNQVEILKDLRFGNIEKTLNDRILENAQSVRFLGKDWSSINFTATTVETSVGKLVIIALFNNSISLGLTNFSGRITGNDFKYVNDFDVNLEAKIDLLFLNGELLIVNHNAVEKIFFLSDYLHQQVAEFITDVETIQTELIKNKEIKNEVISQNTLNYLVDYSRHDQNRMKQIWHVNSVDGRINKFLKHAKNLPKVISSFNLSLAYDDDSNTITMDDTPKAARELLTCMSDRYYLSILFEEPGIDGNKE